MNTALLLLSAVFINSDAWNFWLDESLATMDREQIVAAMKRDVDFYAQPGVEAVFYNMNFQRSFFDTKVGTPYWKDCALGPDGKLTLRGKPVVSLDGEESPEPTYRTMFKASKNAHEKCPDLMRLRYRYCREKGVEMWHSMRMDDVHHSSLKSEFRPQHGDLWLDRAPELARAWYRHFERLDWHDNALDYGIPEVYDYHLRMMREYLLDWESDGIELDWLRALPVFKPGSDEANAGLLTEFVRETRRTADEAAKKWGHRVRIAVRVPGRIRESFLCGLDVATWTKEGLVDILIPTCSNTSTEQDYDIALYRAVANGKLVVPNIDCTMLVAWGFSLGHTAETDAGFISNFFQQGADGIYFYNHFPYQEAKKPFLRRSFVLGGDRAAAARASRRHVVTRHDPAGEGAFPELCFPPWIWKGTGNGGVRVNCGEAVKGRVADAVIGLTVTNAIALRVNTVKCAKSERPLPEPLPKGRKGVSVRWHHFDIPDGVLHDGFNNLEIFNVDGETIEAHQIVWAEIDVK